MNVSYDGDVVLNKLRSILPALMDMNNVPGVSFAVVQDSKVLCHGAFGVADKTANTPVSTTMLFEAGSLSKPVFACAVLKLCESGEIALDEPLIRYLKPDDITPELVLGHILNDENLRRITARHVLSHTSGFPNWRKRTSGQEPCLLATHFVPGERFSYSGEGFQYLQAVTERITGQDALSFATTSVLEPSGMTSGTFVWRHENDGSKPQGHDKDGTPRGRRAWPEMMSAASLHCTPIDYARFVSTLLRPGNSGHLGNALVKQILTPQVTVNLSGSWQPDWPRPEIELFRPVSWGLGWGIQEYADGSRSFWHWGDTSTFQAFVVGVDDPGVAIVLMANAAGASSMWGPLLHEILGKEQPACEWLSRIYRD